MKINRSMKRWVCGMLTLMSGFVLPGTVQANSGGAVTTVDSTSYYVGIKGGSDNEVAIDSLSETGVIGGYADTSGIVGASSNNNRVTVSDGGEVRGNVYGGYAESKSNSTHANYNTVTVSGGSVTGRIYGGYADSEAIQFRTEAAGNIVAVSGGDIAAGIFGGYVKSKSDSTHANYNKVTVSGGNVNGGIYGGYADAGSIAAAAGNHVEVSGGSAADGVYGGYVKSADGAATAIQNHVEVSGGSITGNIYGSYVESGSKDTQAIKNYVEVSGGKVSGDIYGGYAAGEYARASSNSVILSGKADVSEANLYGRNSGAPGTDNSLVIDGWQGTVKSVNNFDRIDFKNLNWKNQETVLAVRDAAGSSLADTDIHLISMAGGQEIHAGDYMYIIKNNGDGTLGTKEEKVTVEKDFTVGVAVDGTGEVSMDGQGNIKFEVTGTSASDQVNLVAENRAVAAAFVNQGTDLISDGLDAMNRDGNYGIKTFAAVHGNRSQYDVNGNLKINGWSTLVGIGNEKKVGSGDFSWGIFYENGSGSYRTYNKFNNEFFRGDGSLLYNGGGIAARLDREDGLYIEGSLRAGTLKSDMSNALKDGAGNSYGYESESTYYGGHIGAGKIFSVNETTDVDVYGKFFHTYTEGDSFAVAGDVFEFDKVTSNRLRIGSRVTTNKEDRLSLYYGLAWEYEFSGDAHMKAQGMSVPEQSLQGSSYMAEVGMHYKPGNASPWRFDLNVRGYAGQREGTSFSAQAGYTF